MPINKTIKKTIEETCKEQGFDSKLSSTIIAWLENQSNQELSENEDINHIETILDSIEDIE